MKLRMNSTGMNELYFGSKSKVASLSPGKKVVQSSDAHRVERFMN